MNSQMIINLEEKEKKIPCLQHHFRKKDHLPKTYFDPVKSTKLRLVEFQDKRNTGNQVVEKVKW